MEQRTVAFWFCMLIGWGVMFLGMYEHSAELCVMGLYPIIIWFGMDRLEQGKKDDKP